MTVTTTLDRQYFDGDGSNKVFPFNFRFFTNDQIYVSLIAPDGTITPQFLTTNYTLAGALQAGGGTVTMNIAPPFTMPATRVFVQRILSQTQPTSIRNQGKFYPEIHEDAFDRLTMLIQQALAGLNNSLQLTFSKTGWNFLGYKGINVGAPTQPTDAATKVYVDTSSQGNNAYTDSQMLRTVRGGVAEILGQLPPAAVRANTVLGFDASGNNPIAVAPLTVDETDVALAQIFPMVILDHATTSWAQISSADYTVDRSIDFANLLDMKKSVIIDTQIALNDTVLVSKARAELSCSPGGILLNGPGMAQKSMLKVTGHHAFLRRMVMDNPAMLKANSGGRQTAVNIQADHCTVEHGTFYRMLHSVLTESNGEWYMPVYFKNVAIDCLGTGAGASDDGSSGFGEDRGDAFLIWGATGVMEHNFAFCMAGQDARIAFHCESLGNDYHTRPNNPARDGFDYWMVDNYAFGNFRRHFAFEAVDRGIMRGNISGGGATWWTIALTGCNDCLAENMTVLYDRTAANTAGAAWSPARAAIGFGHNGANTTLRNIEATFAAGAVGSGLTSLVTNLPALGAVVDNVRIIKPVGQGGIGFVFDKLPDVKSIDCHVVGATTGLTTFGAQDNWIKDFSAYDIIGTAMSLSSGVAGSHARVQGGRVERANRAVSTNNLTTLTVRGLQTKTITTADVEQFGTTGAITIEGNHNEDGNGRLVGFNAPFTPTQVRNISNNPGYVYNLKYQIACITSATSALNTIGKHTERTVTADDGFVYIATGSTAVAPWAKVSTLTTPA